MMFKVFLLAIISLLFFQANGATLPGLNEGFGAGYDARDQMNRMPIFVPFHYDYGQEWTSPYNGKTYSYPDETFLTEQSHGSIIKNTDIYSKWSDYSSYVEKSFGVSVGLNFDTPVDLITVGFRHTQAKFREEYQDHEHMVAIEHRFIPLYQLDIWPGTAPNPHFSHMIDSLPKTANNAADKAQYQNFIEAVGTHVITSAMFGGYLNITCVFDSSLVNKISKEWVSNQVSVSLVWSEISLGIDVGRNSSTDKVNGTFKAHSHSFAEYTGGDIEVIQDKGYTPWLSTVYNMPGLLPGELTLTPVTEYIEDEQKKKTMTEEVVYYMKQPSPWD
eukprot:GCRY01000286.1.p1 GENE.GCRY01000286.1~~GCRY01000286.1.p1  ORF type:complete len:331 (+),score=55.28 GCRY01000286.1:178-1170(+)